MHPLDAEDGTLAGDPSVHGGAAGVLLALDRLAQAGLHEPGRDYARLAGDLLERDAPEPGIMVRRRH